MLIAVSDAKGRSLYTNSIPGLDPSLTSLPVIARGERTFWVNNQIQTATAPRRLAARVGVTKAPAPAALPKLEITKLHYGSDVSGVFARGVIANRSKIPQTAARRVLRESPRLEDRRCRPRDRREAAAGADTQAGHVPRLLHRRSEGRHGQLRRPADRPDSREPVMSTHQPTEPLAPVDQQPVLGLHGEPCASCGAPLAADQRYCLSCGNRRAGSRLPFRDILAEPAGGAPVPSPAAGRRRGRDGGRGGTIAALAGLGVVLLALGMGVLIGHAGQDSSPADTTPQVINLGGGDHDAGRGCGRGGRRGRGRRSRRGEVVEERGEEDVRLERRERLGDDVEGEEHPAEGAREALAAAVPEAVAEAAEDRRDGRRAAAEGQQAGRRRRRLRDDRMTTMLDKMRRRPGAPAAGPSDQADPHAELRARRDDLAERVAELTWDLGGLTYEMAIRDHFRLDVLVRRAAELQEADAELGEVERLVAAAAEGVGGACRSCGAPHSRGATYCWKCGQPLMLEVSAAAVGGDPAAVEPSA